MLRIMVNLVRVFLVMALCGAGVVQAEESSLTNKIESVDFSPLSGGRVSVRVKTTQPLQNPPAGFTLKSPARIALDFPNTANGLNKSNIRSDQGVLKSVTLAQAKDRTRMVLNLTKSTTYNTQLNGNEIVITLQGSAANVVAVSQETRFSEPEIGSGAHEIKNIDFTRGKNGEGRVIVELSDANTGINIVSKGGKVVVDFGSTDISAELQRRLNVINFNTPVLYVDTMKMGENTRIVIEPKGSWEQAAYQADNKFIVDVRPVIEDPNKLVKGAKPGYAGEKLSLNFQNIEVRSVLQVIADFTGLNIVASDTVAGNLTLRLKDVPWDQALDIIMQNKGLTMRKVGNVITVAPTEEVAAKDKAALEAIQAIEDLEPLVTEVFRLKYQKAEDFKNILVGSNTSGGANAQNRSILSKRGSAMWDPRTNTLFVQDTAKKLAEIKDIIDKTDVPVRQVMIESRLVLAEEEFGKSLGARFGIQSATTPGNNSLNIGGTLTDSGNASTGTVGSTSSLNSNLPATSANGAVAGIGLSLFRLPAGLLLNLELTALESDNRGKVISSPRVTTANQQTAKIAQGREIPYQQASSSGATAVSFKEAELSLEVTPQITPDNKIIMDLDVRKDSQGVDTPNGPAINTQNVQTQVLVANGETAVLGGIFEHEERNDVTKVPFFGDLPIIGHAFKTRSRTDDKTELLIFITPKILDESLNLH